MKCIAADVWVPVTQDVRIEASRDEIRGLAVAKALRSLAAETESERRLALHLVRVASGR